jgi:hypothetical protein
VEIFDAKFNQNSVSVISKLEYAKSNKKKVWSDNSVPFVRPVRRKHRTVTTTDQCLISLVPEQFSCINAGYAISNPSGPQVVFTLSASETVPVYYIWRCTQYLHINSALPAEFMIRVYNLEISILKLYQLSGS